MSDQWTLNQKRVDAFLAKGKSAVPVLQLSNSIPPMTSEEKKIWDKIVVENYERRPVSLD